MTSQTGAARCLVESGRSWDWSQVERAVADFMAAHRSRVREPVTVSVTAGFDLVVAVLAGRSMGCDLVIQPPMARPLRFPGRSDTPGAWLFTSGTTGSPKPVRWSWDRLFPEQSSDRPTSRWGIGYAPASFAGVTSVCQAITSNASLEFLTTRWPLTRTETEPLSVAVGTPTFWRMACLNASRSPRSGTEVGIVSMGGEPVDDAVLDEVRKVFRPRRIKQIFGATEIGAVIHVDDERGGLPLEGAGKRQETGAAYAIDEDRLLVSPAPGTPYGETGDVVEVVGDRIFVTGRQGFSINVGGTKVRPQAVERVLNSHPSVLAARAYALRSPVVGSVVAVDIVPAPGTARDRLPSDLRAFSKEHLGPAEQPRRIRIIEETAIGAAGKMERS